MKGQPDRCLEKHNEEWAGLNERKEYELTKRRTSAGTGVTK